MTAKDLRRMAEEAEEIEIGQTLDSVCAMVGVGARALQSCDRTAETAKKRGVVAWVLRDRLKWPWPRVAKALRRTERQAMRLVKAER